MKKFVALLLTLVLTFSLAACGAEGGVKDNEAAGPGSFKIGTLDTGSANATRVSSADIPVEVAVTSSQPRASTVSLS